GRAPGGCGAKKIRATKLPQSRRRREIQRSSKAKAEKYPRQDSNLQPSAPEPGFSLSPNLLEMPCFGGFSRGNGNRQLIAEYRIFQQFQVVLSARSGRGGRGFQRSLRGAPRTHSRQSNHF